jgi:hypothetical protein
VDRYILGHPARLQEAREVAALPELGDVQLDRAGTGLPHPIAVAVALRPPLGRTLAIGGPGQGLHLELLVERVDVREDALEVRIRAEGLASLLGELRQGDERAARAA